VQLHAAVWWRVVLAGRSAATAASVQSDTPRIRQGVPQQPLRCPLGHNLQQPGAARRGAARRQLGRWSADITLDVYADPFDTDLDAVAQACDEA
jgi:hypothetical protein